MKVRKSDGSLCWSGCAEMDGNIKRAMKISPDGDRLLIPVL